ncbi:MAG: hypothetical protein ACO1SV_18245 [Fimbriimonas sp.]
MKRDVLLNRRSVWARGLTREVLLPRGPSHHFVHMDASRPHLHADGGGFIHLAEMAALAAADRERLYWVRRGKARPAELEWVDDLRGMGVLFVNLAAHFRPSDWRDVRRRLGPARMCRRPMEIRRHPERAWYDDWIEDGVDVAVHADTLVVTGSSQGLRGLAEALWAMGLGNLGTWTTLSVASSCGHSHHGDVFLHRYPRWQDGPPYHRYTSCFIRGSERAKIRAFSDAGWHFVRRTSEEIFFRRPL